MAAAPPKEFSSPPTTILQPYFGNQTTMPKAKKQLRPVGNSPYSRPNAAAREAASKAVNNVFRMNTDLGQHILKNPGVAQAIVDKAGLKQSDVTF